MLAYGIRTLLRLERKTCGAPTLYPTVCGIEDTHSAALCLDSSPCPQARTRPLELQGHAARAARAARDLAGERWLAHRTAALVVLKGEALRRVTGRDRKRRGEEHRFCAGVP